MFVFTIQTIFLLLIAFILGCLLGAWLRWMFGSASPDKARSPDAPADTSIDAPSVPKAAAPVPAPPLPEAKTSPAVVVAKPATAPKAGRKPVSAKPVKKAASTKAEKEAVKTPPASGDPVTADTPLPGALEGPPDARLA